MAISLFLRRKGGGGVHARYFLRVKFAKLGKIKYFYRENSLNFRLKNQNKGCKTSRPPPFKSYTPTFRTQVLKPTWGFPLVPLYNYSLDLISRTRLIFPPEFVYDPTLDRSVPDNQHLYNMIALQGWSTDPDLNSWKKERLLKMFLLSEWVIKCRHKNYQKKIYYNNWKFLLLFNKSVNLEEMFRTLDQD